MSKPLFFRYFTLLISCLFCVICQADIYKQVDAAGIATYSNVKINGAVKLNLELPASQSNQNKNPQHSAIKTAMQTTIQAGTPSPAGFPKVDVKTQQQRDGKRKSILQAELSDEKVALNEARQAAEKSSNKPEQAKNLQADINAHQRNIMLLEKEINAM